MVCNFNLIPQGVLEYKFHHRVPSEARKLACIVPKSVSHWLPLKDRHDLFGQGQVHRAGVPVIANIDSGSFLEEIWEGHHQGYKGIILGRNSDSEASILLSMNTKLSTIWQPQRRQKNRCWYRAYFLFIHIYLLCIILACMVCIVLSWALYLFLSISIYGVCLILGSTLNANPETRTLVQVIYLGNNFRKHKRGLGKVREGNKKRFTPKQIVNCL